MTSSWMPCNAGILMTASTYVTRPRSQMEDIAFASPGQKGASMLQFLLSYGTDPLLLDQPEDDLTA